MALVIAPPTSRWIARLWAFALATPALAFALGFDDISAQARDLATTAYRAPVSQLAQELRDLDYDAYRDIRFRPEKALWHGDNLPFELMFFHQGRAVPEPIRVNVIEPSGTVMDSRMTPMRTPLSVRRAAPFAVWLA